jgi:alanine racemase
MWTWIELNRAALEQNVHAFQKVLASSKTCFVLKSNAYGHGLCEIYDILKSHNLPMLAVNYVTEGQTLRKLGYKGRILVVGPFVPEDIEKANETGQELFLGHQEGLDAWLQSSKKCQIHVEFDTGMSRQGFLPQIAKSVSDSLKPHASLVKGVCMHFANVEDVTDHAYADTQMQRFEQAKKEFTNGGFNLEVHAASSASALIMDQSRFDFCRVGVSLYGFWPSVATKISYSKLHGDEAMTLKPVLSWKARLTSINQVQPGQFIGYGCTFKARRAMTVGVVPVGYYEGYPRIVSGSPAYVLIRGERCPIVGRLCMNMMMVDMSDLSKVSVGDTVTLIGQDGVETISAFDVAAWAQTIHYELMTRLNSEIPRKIL